MKLMVLDGNSILNRSYYGIRPLTTKDGFYTQAIYGFLVTMARLEDEERPTQCAWPSTGASRPSAIWSTRATRPSARGCPRSWRCSFR